MVFALPGEPGLTELAGDFKIHFHDRQGDFYWYPPPSFYFVNIYQDNIPYFSHSQQMTNSFFPFWGWGLALLDYSSWLNTTMIENRKVLNTSDLDGFDKVIIFIVSASIKVDGMQWRDDAKY